MTPLGLPGDHDQRLEAMRSAAAFELGYAEWADVLLAVYIAGEWIEPEVIS